MDGENNATIEFIFNGEDDDQKDKEIDYMFLKIMLTKTYKNENPCW